MKNYTSQRSQTIQDQVCSVAKDWLDIYSLSVFLNKHTRQASKAMNLLALFARVWQRDPARNETVLSSRTYLIALLNVSVRTSRISSPRSQILYLAPFLFP